MTEYIELVTTEVVTEPDDITMLLVIVDGLLSAGIDRKHLLEHRNLFQRPGHRAGRGAVAYTPRALLCELARALLLAFGVSISSDSNSPTQEILSRASYLDSHYLHYCSNARHL